MPSEIGCLTRAEPGVIGTSYEDLRGFWAVGCLWLSCTPSERLIRADARGCRRGRRTLTLEAWWGIRPDDVLMGIRQRFLAICRGGATLGSD